MDLHAGGDRRSQLLNEFHSVVAPQKAQLAQRLPDLFKQLYAPPAGLPANAAQAKAPGLVGGSSLPGPGVLANKRPPGDAAGMDAASKRPRLGMGDDIDRRADAIFKEVTMLISRKLWSKKECAPFRQPVDPIKLGIPDYFKYISRPMDLGTVKMKLQRREYATPMEACEDIRLIWRNCATYNQPGNVVRQWGDQLADIWEKVWAESRIEDQWNELMYHRDPSGRALPYKVNQLSGQLRSALAVTPVPATTTQDHSRQMTDIEKRKLSVQLSELQGEQLNGVLDLVASSLEGPAGEEVELDLDALPAQVLWQLKAYADGILHRVNKPLPGGMAAPSKRPAITDGGAGAVSAGGGQALQGGGAQAGGHTYRRSHDMEDAAENTKASSEAGSIDSGAGNSPVDEVKGSTADNPHAGANGIFMRDRPAGPVDESVSNPQQQSAFLKDRAPKPEIQVNAANWDVAALQGAGGAGNDDQQQEEDKLWEQFQTVDETKKKQAEEQQRLKEQQEEEARKHKAAAEAEAARAAAEAEENQRRLKEEEARAAEEQQRARMQQCDKEVDEIKARQGTANLLQQSEAMTNILAVVQGSSGPEGGLAAVGLAYKDDEAAENFDDDE